MIFLDILPILLILPVGLSLVILVVLIYVFLRDFESKQINAVQVENNDYADAVKTLELSHRRALSIINKANKRAQKILRGAELSKDETIRQLTDQIQQISETHISELDQLTSNLMKEYIDVVKDEQSASITTLQDTTKRFEELAASEIETFGKGLTVAAVDAKKRLEQKYVIADKEIDAYKERKIREIDDKVSQLVKDVSKDLLNRTITTSEHEQIVMEKLQEVKDQLKI